MTAQMGITTKALVVQRKSKIWDHPPSTVWHQLQRRWYAAASTRRWIFTAALCALALIVASISCGTGVNGTLSRGEYNTVSEVFGMSFGAADPNSFTAYFLPRTGSLGFIANVLWANCWQIVISFLYIAYNALLSCLLVSEEWGGYAVERKTLRVSHPKGIQRSTYFISMPLKYGIPLMIGNASLHWLVSQSMFLVSTTTYFPNAAEDPNASYTTTGYSSIAALCGTYNP